MPIARGDSSSALPSDWPKPGRSIATSRAVWARRVQIVSHAKRLSGHGLSEQDRLIASSIGSGVPDDETIRHALLRVHMGHSVVRSVIDSTGPLCAETLSRSDNLQRTHSCGIT